MNVDEYGAQLIGLGKMASDAVQTGVVDAVKKLEFEKKAPADVALAIFACVKLLTVATMKNLRDSYSEQKAIDFASYIFQELSKELSANDFDVVLKLEEKGADHGPKAPEGVHP